MKNNVLKLIKYLYYFSLIALFILYLFPGSLIGYFLYGDLGKQPDFIPNPIGTSINHALAFLYLSILGFISYMRDKSFNQTTIFLIFLSIILELSHYFIPNRSFEFLDLFANLLGTLIAIFIIIFYKRYKKIL
jgi:VanZ family protein|tara:strand:- start:238 stop:636 length:399 start_codon:yes stop_codon:yes gene_type:complete